eukprot:TRINITY_DN4912_c0_g1_i1.p1 TRINITY_DN4912_c0_g1~~TRINITY_DN4912_c0_g1_i1.p1  ORF type:complete len:247 (-),score=48.58 TRINITY_DN4912_c0_g1_i1:192-863(-)
MADMGGMDIGMTGPMPPPGPPPEGGEDGLFGGSIQPPPLTLRCKILLLGDSTVGKTSLAQVFNGGVQAFPKSYSMTIGSDLMVKKYSIPDSNTVVEMYIVDCGGFPVCQDLLRPHWESASYVMLVYDVSNPESFDNLPSWYDQVKESRSDSALLGAVIAAKMDLADRPGAVTAEQGKQFSSEKGLQFFETCATKGSVDDPFHFLAECYFQKYCERKADLENLH